MYVLRTDEAHVTSVDVSGTLEHLEAIRYYICCYVVYKLKCYNQRPARRKSFFSAQTRSISQSHSFLIYIFLCMIYIFLFDLYFMIYFR